MDKTTLIAELRAALVEGRLSSSDVRAVLGETSVTEGREEGDARHNRAAHLLYYMGGTIVAIGIAVFVSIHWEELSSFLRILLTLGAGLLLYVAAVFLARDGRLGRLPDAFHIAGALLIPGGVFVTLNEMGVVGGDFGTGLIFLGFCLMYLFSFVALRRIILLLFSIIFGVMSYLLVTDALPGATPLFGHLEYNGYRVLVLGAALVSLGYGLSLRSERSLSGILYAFGTLAILGAALALGDWKPSDIIPRLWESVYPGLSLGAMFLSLRIRSISMLVFGALFTVGYIGKITGEYFADSTGWPLALILIGAAMIGIGYMTLQLSRKMAPRS